MFALSLAGRNNLTRKIKINQNVVIIVLLMSLYKCSGYVWLCTHLLQHLEVPVFSSFLPWTLHSLFFFFFPCPPATFFLLWSLPSFLHFSAKLSTIISLSSPHFFLYNNFFLPFLLPSLCLFGCCCAASCPSAVHLVLLLQLSSPSAYESPAPDELSSSQSMNLSPSNSAQPVPCLNSGPSPSHSSSGAARQVS